MFPITMSWYHRGGSPAANGTILILLGLVLVGIGVAEGSVTSEALGLFLLIVGLVWIISGRWQFEPDQYPQD